MIYINAVLRYKKYIALRKIHVELEKDV